jgi:hypothetical protein
MERVRRSISERIAALRPESRLRKRAAAKSTPDREKRRAESMALSGNLDNALQLSEEVVAQVECPRSETKDTVLLAFTGTPPIGQAPARRGACVLKTRGLNIRPIFSKLYILIQNSKNTCRHRQIMNLSVRPNDVSIMNA